MLSKFVDCMVQVDDRDDAPMCESVDVVASEGEEDILLSDKLAGCLGICILNVARGEWCFEDELKDVVFGRRARRSSL